MVAIMRDWVTTYQTYKLASLHFYKKTLSKMAQLAYMMQKCLQQCLVKLYEFVQEDIDLPFESA